MSTNRIVGRIERLANPVLNAVVVPIMRSPLSRVLQPFITTITFTGRRSGTTFTTPVLYRKRGDGVIIWVASPDSKSDGATLDDGVPITLDPAAPATDSPTPDAIHAGQSPSMSRLTQNRRRPDQRTRAPSSSRMR